MKIVVAILVLICLAFGFVCVFAAGVGALELITQTTHNIVEDVLNWFVVVITLLCGTLCFAVCPLVIEGM